MSERGKKESKQKDLKNQGLGQDLGRGKIPPTQASATITKGKGKVLHRRGRTKKDKEEAKCSTTKRKDKTTHLSLTSSADAVVADKVLRMT